MNELRDQVCAEKEYMINLRRDFHRHPELSLQERRTAGVIEQELERFEISHTRIGATGVLGILRGTQSGSGVVALTIPAAIQDFDYVIITGSIVYNAGIDPSAALATEDILDHLILQVVVKEGNKNADWAQAIVDAYHSDRFKAYLEENNDGLWWVPEELQ